MWNLSVTARNLILGVFGFLLMISLSGCRQISSDPADYEKNVSSYGAWEVRATWVWETAGERMMTIRGLGSWRNEGELFRLKEQMTSTSITTSNESGYLMLEDGTKYSISSPEARIRVERSLFNALDPLKLANYHRVDLKVDGDVLVGEGPCRNSRPSCRFSIELHVDSAYRPVQVRTEMRIGDQSEIVNWAYGKDLAIAW